MPIINVPGHGQVNFPDNMSDDEIAAAIKKNMPTTEKSSANSPIATSIAKGLVRGGGMLGFSPEQVLRGVSGVDQDIQRSVNEPLTQGILGFGNALGNAPVKAANTGARVITNAIGQPQMGGQLPLMNQGNQGMANQVGQALGEGAAYAGASELAAPLMGVRALSGISGIPGMLTRQGARTAGGAAFEGSQSTEDPLAGLAKGGAIQTAMDLATRGVPGAMKYLNADKHLEGMLQNLSKGKNVEENAKSFAENVKNKFNEVSDQASQMYAPVFDKYGKSKLYPKVNNLEGYGSTDFKELLKDPDLRSLHTEFIKNPTLDNAHALQSEIGLVMRDLEKTGQGYADRNTLKALNRNRDALQADIDVGLRKVNPEMANQYLMANENYFRNVVPYKTADKSIAAMAQGDLKNPEKIHHLFKNPEGDIAKIAQDLGPEANHQIMYDLLGRGKNVNPEKILGDFEKAQKEGYGDFISPELQNAMSQLSYKHKGRYLAKVGLGAATAASMLPGIGPMIAGGMIAGKLAHGPKILERASKMKSLSENTEPSLMETLKDLRAGNVSRGALMGASE